MQKAAEDRKKMLEAVQLVAQYAGRGAATLLTISCSTLVDASSAGGWGHFAREAAILTRSLAEAYWGLD